jgi:hypothetical protein
MVSVILIWVVEYVEDSIIIFKHPFGNIILLVAKIKYVFAEELISIFFRGAFATVSRLVAIVKNDDRYAVLRIKPTTCDLNFLLILKAQSVRIHILETFTCKFEHLLFGTHLQLHVLIVNCLMYTVEIMITVYIRSNIWIVKPINLLVSSSNIDIESLIIVTD